MTNFFAIVTFGSPAADYRKIHTSQAAACKVASALRGTGTCSTVRVIACETREEAKAANISTSYAVVAQY